MLKELWTYRYLIRRLAERDLKSRYKVSVLGFFWSLLRPLLTMGILAGVFSLLNFGSSTYALPYPVLLLASYMPWFFFSAALLEGTQSLLSNAHLVKKVYCPRAVFPAAAVLANLINFLLALVVVLPVLYGLTSATLPSSILQLPFVIATHVALLLGLCFLTSVLNVLYRDTTQISEFVVFVWFYLTPVLYDAYEIFKTLPSIGRYVYFLNPMAGINEWYRYALLSSHYRYPTVEHDPLLSAYTEMVFHFAIPYAIVCSLLVLFAGYIVLKRLETRAVDEM